MGTMYKLASSAPRNAPSRKTTHGHMHTPQSAEETTMVSSATISDSEVPDFSIVVLGQTGNGKSQFCHYLGSDLGNCPPGSFRPSEQVDSFTAQVSCFVVNVFGYKVRIIDTPGLNDSKDRDTANIAHIVRALRPFNDIKAVLIVMNPHHDRFCESTRLTIEAFRDIFGERLVSNLALLWTKSSAGLMKRWRSGGKVEKFAHAVKGVFGQHVVGEIPSFFINSKPGDDEYEYDENVHPEIARRVLVWADANRPFSCQHAKVVKSWKDDIKDMLAKSDAERKKQEERGKKEEKERRAAERQKEQEQQRRKAVEEKQRVAEQQKLESQRQQEAERRRREIAERQRQEAERQYQESQRALRQQQEELERERRQQQMQVQLPQQQQANAQQQNLNSYTWVSSILPLIMGMSRLSVGNGGYRLTIQNYYDDDDFGYSSARSSGSYGRSAGMYNGREILVGPRGGRYYINANGNKTYLK
ncbi:gTPase, IMAP member 8 [Quaeritorhiza haematococci]|nr:gTPase, IMAP member 8 [Quaeritorhiza haematococci]